MDTHSHEAVSLNPATGREIARYPYADAKAIEQHLAIAEKAFQTWRLTPVEVRAGILHQMAASLRKHAERAAEMITVEMGKPMTESSSEVEKCAKLCEWFAEHGPAMLADEKAPVTEAEAFISYLPLGPIFAVMPWNFPFWQVMRAAVPILLAGNTFILKHAPNVMGSALLIETFWQEAGLPTGVFQNLNITPEQAALAIADQRIAGVTLTGSVKAGSSVAATAGKAVKKSVLELGGSDAFIVLADANLDGAVKAAIKARFTNTGQVCIAAKRFLLEAPIAAEFTERFIAAAKKLVIGDPLQKNTQLGPLARSDLRDMLHQQVQQTIKQGAILLLGGKPVPGDGFFYEPTILSNLAPGMTGFDEETFGPVAALTKVADAEEAIALANQSSYGLSSNLWCGDVDRAKQLARRIEAGAVFINSFSASDPRVPIGGIKQSGYGRELSHFGLREFTNAQTVWIAK